MIPLQLNSIKREPLHFDALIILHPITPALMHTCAYADVTVMSPLFSLQSRIIRAHVRLHLHYFNYMRKLH